MKICINCAQRFSAANWLCPFCLTQPKIINHFLSFAPTFESDGRSFPIESFSQLFYLEENYFWFRARNKLIIWGLKSFFPNADSFYEVGCGTGFVLSGVAEALPHLKLYGSEIYRAGLPFTRERVPAATLFQMDARDIPFEHEFDIIGAFDVLEHIEEDVVVLKQLHKALKPSGGLLLTIPQHPFLWSKSDEYARHIRRYTADEIKNKLYAANFNIIRMTSFVSFLLPLMFLSRYKKIQKNYDPLREFKINNHTNKMLEAVLNVEISLIQRGMNFPCGGSLFILANKAEVA